jgi:GTP-binding protein
VILTRRARGGRAWQLALRRGDLTNMAPQLGGKTKLAFLVPSRGLIGYRAEFMVDTHGTGVMNRVVHGYVPYKGAVDKVGRRDWPSA